MGLISLNYEMSKLQGRFKHLSLERSEFNKFNVNLLGLGDITKESEHIDALAAMFDLEGFTAFCNQMDPHLVVPEYMSRFLPWLFGQVSTNFTKESEGDKVILWGKFPFFAKYTGDGILFLWDTRGLGQASMGNIIINLYKVCKMYVSDFLPEQQKDFAHVPSLLRCGIARGQVITLGGGKDFVGPCINVAARLQKVSQLSFAFSRKGFNNEQCFGKVWRSQFIQKRIAVRGVSRDELVCICGEEFDALPDDEKNFFRDP